MAVKPVILCGGSGTRLWPLSTPEKPKQFQALTGPESMISLTQTRFQGARDLGLDLHPFLIIGSKRHKRLLKETCPDAELILEPFGRNSAPAVAAACLVSDPDDLLLILPADHHIEKPEAFLEAIKLAKPAAHDGAIVTFGIQPTYPATGYGYIRAQSGHEQVKAVQRFVEKPDLPKAEAYLAEGHYFWNAGIFFFKASTMLTAFEEHAPDVLGNTRGALIKEAVGLWGFDPKQFAEVDDISIDYAIMEHARDIRVVPADMGWNDVGGYEALHEMFADTDEANVAAGPVILSDAKTNFVRSEGPLICASGLENMVVVAKPDTVLIAPMGRADLIKTMGRQAQNSRLRSSVSGKTVTGAKQLLWQSFATWSDLAWDHEKGGFVECLTLDGRPDLTADRRVRVQARQVYSFATAIALGWEETRKATDLVDKGLEYLDTVCRHPEGGWVHILKANGEAKDQTRDLYDHAFIMLAGAAAYQATGREEALALAKDALKFVESRLVDEVNGGFLEAYPDQGTSRRANPHMHLLEAFLELHDATGDPAYLRRAEDMALLFERHFFDPSQNILREFFTSDWQPPGGEEGDIFEPGHHYEWAVLLAMLQAQTGRDTTSWQNRLIKTADQRGRDESSGFAINLVRSDGRPVNAKRRIWPQLEMLRARLWHPHMSVPGSADGLFSAIQAAYFKGMPSGTWLDETDVHGVPTSPNIPASILYHLVTAFSPLLGD